LVLFLKEHYRNLVLQNEAAFVPCNVVLKKKQKRIATSARHGVRGSQETGIFFYKKKQNGVAE